MIKTIFNAIFGTKYPVIQAGMGPYDTTQLASAVSKAGALGLISTVGMGSFTLPGIGEYSYSTIFERGTPEELLTNSIDKVLKNTVNVPEARFGVNIPVSKEFIPTATRLIRCLINRVQTDVECRKKLKAVVTSAGDPLPWSISPGTKILPQSISIKNELPEITWCHVVPSIRGAKRCEQADVDVIIASGREGGAHCSWRDTSSMILIPEVVKTVKKPVVAAGGFADGNTLSAALALGAIGIQMGTRFIATEESEFDPLWKQLLVSSTEEDTLVARGFFGPMRFIRNTRALELVDATLRGSPELYKGNPTGSTQEIIDLEITGLENLDKGDIDSTSVLGGIVAGRIHDIPSVQKLLDSIISEAEQTINNLGNYIVKP